MTTRWQQNLIENKSVQFCSPSSSVGWLTHFGSGFMLLCCLCWATGRDLTWSIRSCLYGCFISKIIQIPMNLLKQCLNWYLPYAGYQTSHGSPFFFGITCTVYNKGYTETDTSYSLQILLSHSHYFSVVNCVCWIYWLREEETMTVWHMYCTVIRKKWNVQCKLPMDDGGAWLRECYITESLVRLLGSRRNPAREDIRPQYVLQMDYSSWTVCFCNRFQKLPMEQNSP